MSTRTAAYHLPVSAEDYLASEEEGFSGRREYIEEYLRPVTAGSDAHNAIAGNLRVDLERHLGDCEVKVSIEHSRVQPLAGIPQIFYYPDVMVACDTDSKTQRYPKLIAEISSKKTKRIDRCEKMLAYLQNETLEEYIIVQQDIPCVTVFRRAEGWAKEELRGWDTPVNLKSLGLVLDMRTIYAGVLP